MLFVVGFHIDLYFLQKHAIPRDNLNGFDFHQTGMWGVLMFFVHTSLVLMLSLERQQQRFPEEPFFIPFMLRRTFRIFPLSVFIVALVWLLALPVGELKSGTFSYLHLDWTGILSNFLLLQNVWHKDSIIPVLWTLPFEMQMYLTLPAIYLLVRFTKGPVRIIALWAVAAFFCSHTYRLQQLGLGPLVELTTYIPCFLSGVVAYKLGKSRGLGLVAVLWPVFIGAITLIYLRWHLTYTCCFLLGLGIPQFREIANPVVRRVSQLIARYSYGIYLTHWIVIWLVFQALRREVARIEWIVLIAGFGLFPYVLYHYLEEPMIRYGGKIAGEFYRRRLLKLQLEPVPDKE